MIVRIGRRDPSTVYEVEVTSGIHATRPIGVPTWEDFKQRHFIDGIPLPVRPRRREQVPPPSWHEMVRAVQEAHRAFRTELIQLLTAALPGHDIVSSRRITDPYAGRPVPSTGVRSASALRSPSARASGTCHP